MSATQKINFLTLVSYSLLQTVFREDTKRTDDRQTTQCAKGATDSTVGQKVTQAERINMRLSLYQHITVVVKCL